MFEDETNQILEINSQKQLLNDLVSKCKKLVCHLKAQIKRETRFIQLRIKSKTCPRYARQIEFYI